MKRVFETAEYEAVRNSIINDRVLAHLSKSNSRTFQGPYEGYIRSTKLKQTGTFISISRRSGPVKSS